MRQEAAKVDLKQSLEVVSRTGRYVVGYRRTVKEILARRPAAVVASTKSSGPLLKRVRILSQSMGVPLLLTELTPAELGLALRKPFPTSFIAVLDPGSSDIAEQVRAGSGE